MDLTEEEYYREKTEMMKKHYAMIDEVVRLRLLLVKCYSLVPDGCESDLLPEIKREVLTINEVF